MHITKATTVGVLFAIIKVCSSIKAVPEAEGQKSTIQLSVNSTTRPFSATKCPSNWRHFGSKCYKIFSNRVDGVENKDYDGAREYCDGVQGSMATIHSQEEQDFLTTYLGEPEVRNRVWIGLEKHPTEAGSNGYVFKWVDGTTLGNLSNFALDEPNGELTEKCVHLDGEEAIAGQWNDVSCSQVMGFVCEFNLTSDAQQGEGLSENPKCPPGFKFYLDICYHVEEKAENWYNAEETCREKYGGHLLSIVDLYEEAYISLLTTGVTSELWIGLSDTVIEVKGLFSWSDKRPIYHTKWAMAEPTEKGDHRCVTMNSKKKWKVRDCSTKMRFICAKHQKFVKDVVPPMTGTCPKYWIDVGNSKCYYVESDEMEPFSYAMRTCRNLVHDEIVFNSTLAEIRSEHDLKLLRPHMSQYGGDKTFAVGIKQTKYGHFYFAGEETEEATFLPWDRSQPNVNEHDKCVYLNTNHMKYLVYNCDASKYYICQADKIINPEVASHPEAKGLSGGGVAAIVIVMLLLIVGLAGVAFYFYRKNSMDSKMKSGIFQFQNDTVNNHQRM